MSKLWKISSFDYNIDTILSDPFVIIFSCCCLYLRVIIHHIRYPDTHWVMKCFHRHISIMFLCCNKIHHSSSYHYSYIDLDEY